MTAADWVLLRLAWVVATLAVAVVASGILCWKRRWWSLPDRVCYTALAGLTAAQVHFLVWWNYLPGRW
ncbi:MAG: hypothetical protein FJ206_05880 [Gemmatimonadetes bacterium]|nr:hypothetical protein [Gemmatimonadota bacterium]